MSLDPEHCYRALQSRDARFDGVFFVGVTSTGIYCRPICPARTALRKNCVFVRTAAEAEQLGLRPCLRCRPESAPGTPAWRGTETTADRARRLIDAGALDTGSVDQLAERLGVGARQMRRLCAQHFGVSPVQLAQTRRLLFAKKLLSETSLPVADVSAAAGFASLRRFNELFRERYQLSPTALRRSLDGEVAGPLTLRLAYRPPLEWCRQLDFFGCRMISSMEQVADHRYRRAVMLDSAAAIVSVAPAAEQHGLAVTIDTDAYGVLPQLVHRLRRVFDLDAQPETIAEHLGRDAVLKACLKKVPGVRVPGTWDAYEAAVRAVLGQQVSVKAATTMASRLVEQLGQRLPKRLRTAARGLTHFFPKPSAVARGNLALGLPARRAETLIAVSRYFARHGRQLLTAPTDTQKRELLALPGIGPWTLQYVAMRGWGDPDAFLSSDLVIRKALATGQRLPKGSEVEQRSQSWRPWRAYAAVALWEGGQHV